MVKVRKDLPRLETQEIDIDTWLDGIQAKHDNLIREAVFLSRLAGEEHTTHYGSNCFEESLEIAEIIARLNLGTDAIAAALVCSAAEHAELSIEDIEEQLGRDVAALVVNVKAMQSIARLEQKHGHNQIDNIRKMLLAMVRDVRAVVIKIAERLCVMRAQNKFSEPEQIHLAHETSEVYAPLASRLGISELKWELEDLAFSILHRETYHDIARKLQERRIQRDARVEMIISRLQQALSERHIEGKVYGRAKHIYSICKKMQRKNVPFEQIYDAMAVRILVPDIKDCYAILSFAHEYWEPIQEEFDDYIRAPKPNGYQSIHTAVRDPDGKVFEIQIRTFKMHEESEMGVAAHWLYKEGEQASSYDEKIKWLRQLLDWQKEVSNDAELPKELERNVFEDRVYVFTPDGKIIDLPRDATSLDFAYQIHTEIGHRCRGAKVNHKIVPLTQPLELGDTIEILTAKHAHPSRDWLIPQRGYLKSTRARAKVLQWFKQLDEEKHLEIGKQLLERELQRLSLDSPNLDKFASKFKYSNGQKLLAALGRGDVRLANLINVIQGSKPARPILEEITAEPLQKRSAKNDVTVYGVGDLKTNIANCCRPLPGDEIIGYITQGYGVTIHRADCKNAAHLAAENGERMIEVEWENKTHKHYPATIHIEAYDRTRLLSDITQILQNLKVSILSLNSKRDKKAQLAFVELTIEVKALDEIGRIIDRLFLIPNVKNVQRAKNQTND